MRISVFIMLLLSSLCSAEELPYGPMPNPSQYNYSIWLAKHIDISNGVQSYEANVIAHVFYISGISGCGAPGQIRKDGDYWIFPTRVGFAAKPGSEILVHALTGEVES